MPKQNMTPLRRKLLNRLARAGELQRHTLTVPQRRQFTVMAAFGWVERREVQGHDGFALTPRGDVLRRQSETAS